MSQTGNAFRATDEIPISPVIPNSPYVPMIPMILPYPGAPNRTGQQFYMPSVYPNFPAHQLANGPPHPANYPMNFNPYYFVYPPTNNFMPSSMSMTNLPSLMSVRPLAPNVPSYSSLEAPINASDTNRNKSLNIRECQSPTISSTQKTINIQTNEQTNENTSTEASPLEPESTARTSSCEDEMESEPSDEEFLTFIKQKSKRKTPSVTMMSQLNRDSHTSEGEPSLKSTQENLSSYRLLFDNFIEKTHQAIEQTKKLPKKVAVDDASVQYDSMHNRFHRSTQTISKRNNVDLIEDHSLQMMKLMDKLLDEFRRVYQTDPRNDLKSIGNLCDELHQSIVFMRLVSTSDSSSIPTKIDKPFRDIIEETENNFSHVSKYPPSLQRTLVTGRGNRQLMPSINVSPVPSFSCRSIESTGKTSSSSTSDKLCLICQKPVDQNEKFLHQWCR